MHYIILYIYRTHGVAAFDDVRVNFVLVRRHWISMERFEQLQRLNNDKTPQEHGLFADVSG